MKLTILVDVPEYEDGTEDPHDVARDLLSMASDLRRANGDGVLLFFGAEWGDHLPPVAERVEGEAT